MNRAPDQAVPRVCIVTGNFYPVVGGGERHAQLLGRAMVQQGARVLVITRRRYRELARREVIDGIEVHRVAPAGCARTGKYLMLMPAVWRLWRERASYDVIYVCGLRVLGLAGVVAGWLTGKPCVLRAEARGEMDGAFIWQSPEGRVSAGRRLLFRPLIAARNGLFRRAAGFLSISTPISEEFLAAGVPAARMEVIPNGIDVSLFAPLDAEARMAMRQRLGWPAGRIFAYAGKLNRGKGLELLLRVWTRYAARHADGHLVLIGSGGGQHLSCEETLRAMVRENGLEARVTFTGYVERVGDYLAAADVFVFPSESESMGLVVLEAMACGVPVIASRIPGVMDMVRDGETGMLIETRDEAAWLAALEGIDPADPAIARQVAAGIALVRERYGIEAVARRHLAWFARLA